MDLLFIRGINQNTLYLGVSYSTVYKSEPRNLSKITPEIYFYKHSQYMENFYTTAVNWNFLKDISCLPIFKISVAIKFIFLQSIKICMKNDSESSSNDFKLESVCNVTKTLWCIFCDFIEIFNSSKCWFQNSETCLNHTLFKICWRLPNF